MCGIILEKFHNNYIPIVLIRVHLVQIYTTDGATCHAVYCKHSNSTGIPARPVIFGITKKIKTVIR